MNRDEAGKPCISDVFNFFYLKHDKTGDQYINQNQQILKKNSILCDLVK